MQLLSAILCVSTLASEALVTAATSPRVRTVLLHTDSRPASELLPVLPLVPPWTELLVSAQSLPRGDAWRLEPPAAPVARLNLREVYALIAELPELDRVGRFAHVNFLMPGLSAGPELSRLSTAPPREDYPRAQLLSPGGSLWYKPRRERWAVGLATGTRFLLVEQSSALVDPFTSEARWAFFLP